MNLLVLNKKKSVLEVRTLFFVVWIFSESFEVMGMKSNQRWILVFFLYFVILLTIIVSAYLGIVPVKISAIPLYDTIGHFILLGIASYLGHKALGNRMINIGFCCMSLPLAPILISIFALLEESLQVLSPLRSSTLSDFAANLIGIWFFYWLASLK